MHIANKIDAKDKKLSEILSGQRYKIDVFQREYRWHYRNIDSLISDLTSSFLKSYKDGDTIESYNKYDCYYMGPIVLCQDENGDLSIVDGQQRLTSFTLLLIYLAHQQERLEIDEDCQKDITRYLFVKKGGRSSLVLNVDERAEVINTLIMDPKSVHDNPAFNTSSESVQNIIARYNNIESLFPSEICTVDILPLFIEWLLDKVVLVEVKAYTMENAYTIFETMNDRGLSLNPTEILKGFLLSKIVDEEKAEEANQFWTKRIQQLKAHTDSDQCDMDFFRAWLRAKYAETKRASKVGSENEDFEQIASQYHDWVKNNLDRIQLDTPDDFYYFICSDLDFYSQWYCNIFTYKTEKTEGLTLMYVNNFFPIADSLTYPLFLSAISKLDDTHTILTKLQLTAEYIDRFTNIRSIQHRTITQSSIRNTIYDNIKSVRNQSTEYIEKYFHSEISRLTSTADLYKPFHPMVNWSYGHYFFARLRYYISPKGDFADLLRSRKQSSYILSQIFEEKDFAEDDTMRYTYLTAMCNHVLIRRREFYEYRELQKEEKISYLAAHSYLPEMKDSDNLSAMSIEEFLSRRDCIICDLVYAIWRDKSSVK